MGTTYAGEIDCVFADPTADSYLQGRDGGHADGYATGMKTFSIYFIVIALALLFAAAQPGEGVPEAHAAMAIAGPDLAPTCKTSACLAGWQEAHDHAINDEAECSLISTEAAEA